MTWDDYRPIPNTNWVDPAGVPTVRGLRIALVAIDFPDQPFVITMPKNSDLFGNPQIDPIPRAQVPQFYRDHFMQPGPLNNGHTIHEYWMEQSRGQLGVTEVVPFGPYLMPRNLYEYGLNEWGQTPACPTGSVCNGNMDTDANLLWQLDQLCVSPCGFDVVMRIYAGYDETSVWQEFGEMMFQTQDDIPEEWGNPDPTKPNWAPTRYVPWTSWKAAAQQWGQASIRQGESSGTITHEMAHFFFSIGDNNNNPFATPYHRVGSAPWDIMDRGSFNGPGGHHMRWVVPVNMGGWMPAGLMVRNKITMAFLPENQILRLDRNGLALSGLVVAKVTARAVDPGASGNQSGIRITLDADQTPPCDTNTDPYCHGNTWNHYTAEVMQRLGYDSFTPDSGVLISKNKTGEGNTCGYNCFNWVIDAHPEDMNMVDYYKPDGTAVMRTVADHRQLNDALFHAGLNSGSQYEWGDSSNNLHFYVVDRATDVDGVLSYTIGVQNPTGDGLQTRGVSVANPAPVGVSGLSGYCNFPLTNTGAPALVNPPVHPEDVTAYVNNDIYRLSTTAEGSGWNAQLVNALATAAFGATVTVPVYVTRDLGSALTGTIRLTATSVSDVTKTSTGTCSVTAQPTAVALRSFSARRTGARAVALRWQTGAEAGLLGFNLYRGRVRLTRAPIRARNATGGARYAYVDRLSARARTSYRLQAVSLDGSRVWLGSVSAG